MSHFKQRLALFRIQPFRLYAIGCMIAMLGSGISYIAMTWMVLQLEHTLTSVVIVMFCFWLPSVVLGPFAGVLVDRYSRKRMYVLVNWLRGSLMIVFGVIGCWHQSALALYVLSLLQGVVFTLVLPVVMALIRELVEEPQLMIANATIDIAYELGNVIGMALAGAALALISAAGTFILDGMLFLLAGLLGLKMQVKAKSAVSEASLSLLSVMQDMWSGLQYVLQRRALIVIYVMQLLMIVAFMTTPILTAPFASKVLHANVAQFGALEAWLSIGVVVGGLFVPWLAEHFGLLRMVVVLQLLLAMAFIMFSSNHIIWVADALNFVIGFALAVWPLIMTRAQEMTALDYQGRVQSMFNCVSGACILVVYCLVNLGSHRLSMPHLYWVEVVLCVFGIVLVLLNLKAVADKAGG